MTFGRYTVNMKLKKRDPHLEGRRKQPKRAEKDTQVKWVSRISILQKIASTVSCRNMKQERYLERTDSNVQWRGNLPLNSESVPESSLPGKQVKKAKERQRPGTIKEWISSNVAFEREAKSVKIKYRWFRIPQKQQNLNHIFRSIHFFIQRNWKEAPFWQSQSKKGPPSEWRSSWKPNATDQLK